MYAAVVYRSECSDRIVDWLTSIAICRSRTEAETVEQDELERCADATLPLAVTISTKQQRVNEYFHGVLCNHELVHKMAMDWVVARGLSHPHSPFWATTLSRLHLFFLLPQPAISPPMQAQILLLYTEYVKGAAEHTFGIYLMRMKMKRWG